MHPQVLEKYFPFIQQMSRRLDSDPGALQELLHTIERYKDDAGGEQAFQDFFKGEYAFYNGLYERSLNHYLNARGVDHFEFFCYRASAFIFKEKGDTKKALRFVKKALGIFPEDYVSQLLFRELLTPVDKVPESCHDHETCDVEPNDISFDDITGIGSCPSSDLNPQESIMNTDTNLYSYASTADPTVKAMLTQRLYPSLTPDPYLIPVSQDNMPSMPSFEEFKYHGGEEIAFDMSSTSIELDGQKDELDIAYSDFSRDRSSAISSYLKSWKNRISLPDDCLYLFHGWSQEISGYQDASKTAFEAMQLFLSESLNKASGGFYLRWNNQGVVINPGRSFLQQFHMKGLHIRDIDFVICTHDQIDTYIDIREIYELNSCLNKTDGGMHIIQYFLNQAAYRDLSSLFKTSSKVERRAIHSLELFADSSDVERIELAKGIQLLYFSSAPSINMSTYSQSHTDKHRDLPSTLGIRLELSSPSIQPSFDEEYPRSHISLGYISGNAWSPFVAHQLNKCDILLAGVGNTNSQDYNKISHMDDCLGYFGICSLVEDVQPRLLLCTEFSRRDGDLRLEMIKKLRAEHDLTSSLRQNSTILPADSGMFIDLKSLAVMCSLTGKLVDASQIRVLRPAGKFSQLQYLSPGCLV